MSITREHARFAKQKDAIVRKFLTPTHVCEVGVCAPLHSHVRFWIGRTRVTLIDANPLCCSQCKQTWGDKVTVVHGAVVNDARTRAVFIGKEKSKTFGAAFLQNTDSPAAQIRQDKNWISCFEAPVLKFDTVDDGTIDYLTIDIEGCEFYVLQAMVSRPKVIFVEMQAVGYENPNLDEICQWMQREGYEQQSERVGFDWCWVRTGEP